MHGAKVKIVQISWFIRFSGSAKKK